MYMYIYIYVHTHIIHPSHHTSLHIGSHHKLRTLPSAPSCCWPQKGNRSVPLETCQKWPKATLHEPQKVKSPTFGDSQ